MTSVLKSEPITKCDITASKQVGHPVGEASSQSKDERTSQVRIPYYRTIHSILSTLAREYVARGWEIFGKKCLLSVPEKLLSRVSAKLESRP